MSEPILAYHGTTAEEDFDRFEMNLPPLSA